MSKYTTEVRYICENAYNRDTSKIEPATVDNIISSGIKECFCQRTEEDGYIVYNFLFDLYDTEHYNELCSKILRHYYFNEIGFETFGQWKLFLISKLRDIMPYYNELYRTAEMDFNPFIDTDYSEFGVRNDEGKTDKNKDRSNRKSEVDIVGENNSLRETDKKDEKTFSSGETDSTSNENGNNLYSDTPQNGLTDVRQGNYLTNATATDSEKVEKSGNISQGQTEQERERENTLTTDRQKIFNGDFSEDENEKITNKKDSLWNETVKGKRGTATYSKMLLEYRKTIVNIDAMIIDELKDLFMLLW